MLVDAALSGLIIGQTLRTRAEQGYRALLEATAFGARMIVETFGVSGVPVREFVVAGGLLRNRPLMQLYADVLRMPISIIGSEQGPALGSAIHAAVAAGAYDERAGGERGDGPSDASGVPTGPASRRGLRPAVRGVPARCTTTSGGAATTS